MKEYITQYTIPQSNILEFSDTGLLHVVHDDGTVETDDLRHTIVLSSGMVIVLDCDARVVLTNNEAHIQFLVPVPNEK